MQQVEVGSLPVACARQLFCFYFAPVKGRFYNRRQHHMQDCGISIKAPFYMAMEFAMSAYNHSAVELIEIP